MTKQIRQLPNPFFIRIAMAVAAAHIAVMVGYSPAQAQQSVSARERADNNLSATAAAPASPQSTYQPLGYYGKLPLSFEPNQGQVNGGAKFVSRGIGYTILLSGNEAILELDKPSADDGQASTKARQNPRLGTDGSPKSSGKGVIEGGQAATGGILRLRLAGANAEAAVAGMEELAGKSNYFIGNDPGQWRTNVENYAKVKYHEVYPGVDLVFYGTQGGKLEYDFVVAPGADPHAIGLSLQGAQAIRVEEETGDLVVTLNGSELRFLKPTLYQPGLESDLRAGRRAVEGGFVLTGKNRVGFQVGAYDRQAPLIIDPVLSYSTFLGGSPFNFGTHVAVDSSGNAYVAGITNANNFEATPGALRGILTPGGCHRNSQTQPGFACPDAFVAKLNSTGTALVYSTYLGGSGPDGATSISVDSSGNAYVTGVTGSSNFPTTTGSIEPTLPSTSPQEPHVFAAKLNPTGSALLYSTYLAGSNAEAATSSALDAGGNLYVAGSVCSSDFPFTAGAFQTVTVPCSSSAGAPTGLIAKLNPQGTHLIYATALGGTKASIILGLAVDSSGNAYVTGSTHATDFPTLNAFQSSFGPTDTCGEQSGTASHIDQKCYHAFVSKLNPTGTALVYSTYLGGSHYDGGFSIALDSSGAAYVAGTTNSTDFPTTTGAVQTSSGGGSCGNPAGLFNCTDAFLTKFAPNGTMAYSTYLGGDSFDFALGVAVDAADDAYVAGGTTSLNFPVSPSSPTFQGGTCASSGPGKTDGNGTFWNRTVLPFNFNCPNAFLTAIDPTGSTLLFSTYLGGANGDVAFGVALDGSGGTYVAGSTISDNFPTSTGAIQTTIAGYADAFVTKYLGVEPGANLSPSTLAFAAQVVGTTSVPQTITLTNTANTTLNITSIVASTNFGETDNCNGTVPASGSCTLNVTFTPMTSGPLAGTITLTDNSNGVAGSTQTVPLSGTGAPLLSPSITKFFGSATIAVGGSATLYFTLDNPNSASMLTGVAFTDNLPSGLLVASPNNLSGTCGGGTFTAAPGGSSVSLTGATLAGGAGCELSVDVTGTSAGTANNSVTVNSTNGGAGNTSTASLAVIAPPGSISPGTLSFENQTLNTPSTAQSVSFQNVGASAMTVSSISVVGTNPGDFTFTLGGTCGASLAANATCQINVTFDPTATGARSGSLDVAYTESGLPRTTLTVALTGTGTAATAGITPSTLTFGNQNVGATSAPQPVTLSNTGTSALTLTSIFPAANFGESDNCNGSVAAGATCTINVTFTPAATGPFSGSLTVTDNSNAVAGSTQAVTLSGTGTQPMASLSSTSLSFSAQASGTTSAAQTVTLSNPGSGVLTISGITVSGDFAETSTCGASVAAGANCTISVTFKPTTGGARSGTLSISDNVTGSPQSVSLSGTGQDFSMAPPAGGSTTASTAPGSTATFTLSVGGQGGLTGSVNFTVSGCPSQATCTVSPNPVTAGSTPTNVTVTVTTAASSVAAPRSHPPPPPPSPGLKILLMLALVLAALAWTLTRRGHAAIAGWRSVVLPRGLGLLLALGLAACGGGGGTTTTTTQNAGTPAGTYTLTVTGSTGSGASAISHSQILMLTVS